MSNNEEKALRVVGVIAENVKRLRMVRITPNPDAGTVVIGGKNAQGKSSLLDAIEMALGGGKSIPAEPVRHGARKARVVVDLGDIVVERTFSAKGTALEVRGKDGLPKASPQKLLDSLCSKVSFDPLEFARAEPKKQDETLKRVLGLDFSDIEAARAKLYEQRTAANREMKRLEALIESMPEHRDAPKEPIDVKETAALLKAAHDANRMRAGAAQRIATARQDLADQDEEIAALEQRIAQAQKDLAAQQSVHEAMAAAILESERDLPPEQATTELEAKLESAETVNAKVRANAEKKKLDTALFEQEKAVDELTQTIASLDEEKASRLAAAKFPIEGLGFDDAGPTLNSVPLAQASQAEALRLSVAIGAALNPRVKIALVREGSRLDDDGMALLEQLAKETGLQVWVERVGTGDAGAVIIEDGTVVEPAAESAAE